MKLKFVVMEDFLNYKKPSMFIGTSYCTFKCEKDCPNCHCQNSDLAKANIINIENDAIVKQYLNNDITQAIVFGGLEPFDQFDEIFSLIGLFREHTNDDIVIYTGYTEEEVKDKVNKLKLFTNIIVKFGRYRPDNNYHYDETLGIDLISDNQYAKVIS